VTPRKPVVWTIGVSLVAAAVATAVWVAASSRAAGQVAVTWSADSPNCVGTTVRSEGSGPVIEAKAGMTCVVTVKVANDGGHDVRLTTAVAPLVGPRTGAVIAASNADASGRNGLDAHYQLDRRVRAGEAYEFDIVLRFHPSGCNESATPWIANWPTVGLTVMGRSFERASERTYRFHNAGRTPGCMEPG
jgi:hypothetical protein